jgi:hypothetical protein
VEYEAKQFLNNIMFFLKIYNGTFGNDNLI